MNGFSLLSVALFSFIPLSGGVFFECTQTNVFSYFTSECTDQVEVVMVGDVMLGRHVETLMDREGVAYPFDKIKEVLFQADVTIGNLEGVIQSPHIKTAYNTVRFSFAPKVATLLKSVGFDALSLGNNHSRDFGSKGINATRTYLEKNNIKSFGDFNNSLDTMVYHHEGEVPLLVVGVHDTFNYASTTDVVENISLLRSAHRDTYVIVYIHWGDEYMTTSSRHQRIFARKMIDAGADAVVGHHPHVVQEIEVYDGAPIFYSLGNFIFDQYFSEDVKKGLLLKLSLSKMSAVYTLVPLQSLNSQPDTLTGEAKKNELKQLQLKSKGVVIEDMNNGILRFSR